MSDAPYSGDSPERKAVVPLLELDLLLERQVQRFLSHIEHFFNFILDAMIFEAYDIWEGLVKAYVDISC